MLAKQLNQQKASRHNTKANTSDNAAEKADPVSTDQPKSITKSAAATVPVSSASTTVSTVDVAVTQGQSIGDRATDARDEYSNWSLHESKIMKMFKGLDNVLFSFRSKQKTGSFRLIKDAFERVCQDSFSEQKLEVITHIAPDMFKLRWEACRHDSKGAATDFELIVELGSHPSPTPRLQERLKYFRCVMHTMVLFYLHRYVF